MKKINEDIVNISVNFKLTELFSPDLNGIYRIQNPLRLDCRPVEMEKILGGLEVFQKMLDKLVSWLNRSFNWNRLKYLEILNVVEVGNANFQYK